MPVLWLKDIECGRYVIALAVEVCVCVCLRESKTTEVSFILTVCFYLVVLLVVLFFVCFVLGMGFVSSYEKIHTG